MRKHLRLWGPVLRDPVGPARVVMLAVLALLNVEATAVKAAAPGQEASPGLIEKWTDVGGTPLPFQTVEEVKEFLRTAEVLSLENIPLGVTHPRRALLEKGGIRIHAIFRDVDIQKDKFKDAKGLRIDFRDHCIYECAAYELSVLLGLECVPPVVPRKIKNEKGTLQIWIENTMTEMERQERGIQPPNRWRWMMQQQVMRVFDELIFNDDRNQGNMIIDDDWNLWLIDHTRAFRTYSKPASPEVITYCERNLWEALQNLDEATLEARLKEFLRPKEISSLLKRRDALVKHIQKLIDKKGEKEVLFSFY